MLLPLGEENGRQARQGAEIALDELNRDTTQLRFEARWEDSRNQEAETGTRMEALAQDPAVLGVVGPINSGPATNAADVANRAGVVLISPLASTPTLSRPDDFFFRTYPSDAIEARFSAEFARNTLGLRRVVILNIAAPYGQALAHEFSSEFQRQGGTVADSIEYSGDTQRFGAFAERVISRSPDALYYVGYPPDIAEVMRELRSRNITFPVLSSAIISDPSVPTLAGENVEGVIFPFPSTFRDSAGTARMEAFEAAYRQRFGQAPSFVAAQTYDAVMMLARAIRAVQSAPDGAERRRQVQDALDTVRQVDGATGVFRLDPNGDAVRQYRMYRIERGQMVPYEPTPTAPGASDRGS